MREIAEVVGVSSMTVSRALRNDPKISDQTKERVRTVCEEMGYVPDPRVSELMSHLRRSWSRRSVETIAYLHLLPEAPTGAPLVSEKRMQQGCVERTRELGFHLDEFLWKTSEISVKRMIGILRARGIRGIMAHITGSLPQEIDDLISHFAMATTDETMTTLNHAIPDHFKNMSIAIDELWRRGYRRIGFYLLHRVKDWTADNWKAAMVYHLANRGAYHPDALCLQPTVSEEVLRAWMARYRPDVIISHIPVVQIAECLRKIGMRAPEDIGIASVEWQAQFPDIAGIDQNSEWVGASAVDLVARQLAYNETGYPPFPKKLLVGGQWRDGMTVRPPGSPTETARP